MIYIEAISEHLKKNELGSRRKRTGEDVIPAIEQIGGFRKEQYPFKGWVWKGKT